MNKIPQRITAEKIIGGKKYHVYAQYGTKERAETVARHLESESGGYRDTKIVKVHFIPIRHSDRALKKAGYFGARKIYYTVYVPGPVED